MDERDDQGRPIRARDADGHTAWTLAWSPTGLTQASLRLPGGDTLTLNPGAATHAVLGRCDAIELGGVAIARVAAVPWHAPTHIPAVDVPGALPPGAGTAVLNLLATLAAHAGRKSLRYRGPYPTAALFAALHASFDVIDDGDAAEQRFVADLEHAAVHGVALEPAVDFVPAPHRWSWPAPRVCAQHRRGLERLWIDGRPFAREGLHHVLVREGEDWCAQVIFAGSCWHELGRFDASGRPRTALVDAPAVSEELVGLALPTAMVEVLAQVLVADAAAGLRTAITHVLAEGITLADIGLAPARAGPMGLQLHAALAERALALAPDRSLATFAAALREPVLRAAQAWLAARIRQ